MTSSLSPPCEAALASLSNAETGPFKALSASDRESVLNHWQFGKVALLDHKLLEAMAEKPANHMNITLKGCTSISIIQLYRAVQASSNLTRLDLSGCQGPQDELKLSLSGVYWSKGSLFRLMAKQCRWLEHLNLSGWNLHELADGTPVTYAVYALEFPNLKTVELNGCSQLRTLSLKAPNLTSFSADGSAHLKSLHLDAPKLEYFSCWDDVSTSYSYRFGWTVSKMFCNIEVVEAFTATNIKTIRVVGPVVNWETLMKLIENKPDLASLTIGRLELRRAPANSGEAPQLRLPFLSADVARWQEIQEEPDYSNFQYISCYRYSWARDLNSAPNQWKELSEFQGIEGKCSPLPDSHILYPHSLFE